MSFKFLPVTLDVGALDTLIGLMGGSVPLGDSIDAAYHVLGFVLTKFVNDTPKMGAVSVDSLTVDEKVELLEKVKACCCVQDGVKAIDIPWALVWALVQQIVNKYLES